MPPGLRSDGKEFIDVLGGFVRESLGLLGAAMLDVGPGDSPSLLVLVLESTEHNIENRVWVASGTEELCPNPISGAGTVWFTLTAAW